jgi:TPR repeat protein
VYWYRKAAEQGHGEAQHNLGTSYYYGNGVKKNHREAKKWLQKAERQGFSNYQK